MLSTVLCVAWHIPTVWDQVSDLSRTARTASSRVVGRRKLSFAGTWMYRRLSVEVISSRTLSRSIAGLRPSGAVHGAGRQFFLLHPERRGIRRHELQSDPHPRTQGDKLVVDLNDMVLLSSTEVDNLVDLN